PGLTHPATPVSSKSSRHTPIEGDLSMSKKLRMLAAAAVLASAAIATPAPSASAWDFNPGYWKNHTSAWPGMATSKTGVTMNLSPSTRVGDVFPGANVIADCTPLQAPHRGRGTR